MEVCDLCRKAAIKGPGKEMFKIHAIFSISDKEFSIHAAHVDTISARLASANSKVICGTCLKRLGIAERLEETKKILDEINKKDVIHAKALGGKIVKALPEAQRMLEFKLEEK